MGICEPSSRRRWLCAAGAGAGLAALGGAPWQAALAQAGGAADFPNRPVKLIVPFPPGGPTDTVARLLAEGLQTQWKQNVIIDYKPGAGTMVGTQFVAKAAPDGYTLGMAISALMINPALQPSLPYDTVRELTGVSQLAQAHFGLFAHPSAPFNTMPELLAYARANPDKLSYATPGTGTGTHLAGEMLNHLAGIKLLHVPYKGSAPAVTDLVGGQIPLMFDPVQSVLAQVQGGRLRALAVSSRERSPVLPQVPTVAESGYRGFEAEAWWAVFAPAKLGAAETALLRREIERVVRSQDFRSKLGNLGVTPAGAMKGSFADFNKAEMVKWGKAVRDSGASLD